MDVPIQNHGALSTVDFDICANLSNADSPYRHYDLLVDSLYVAKRVVRRIGAFGCR